MILDPRPTRRHQNNHTDLPASQVLLMAKILVCGDESVKPVGLSASE
jgi:hypothetical protein